MPGSKTTKNEKYHQGERPICFMLTNQFWMDSFCPIQRHQPAVDINVHRMGPWDSPQKHTQSCADRKPGSRACHSRCVAQPLCSGWVYHTSSTDALLTLCILSAPGHSHKWHSACPGMGSPDLVPLENADRMKDTQ